MSQNYFELFNLPTQYAVDLSTLDVNYRKIQSEVHPDRFVTGSSAEKLRSMQLATLANEAYQTLRNPAARARYLLQLHGIETLEESNTAMPADFLMQQMEWREAIEDASAAKNVEALDHLLRTMRHEARHLQAALQASLDKDKQFNLAAEIIRKLSFIDKVRADIEQSIAQIED